MFDIFAKFLSSIASFLFPLFASYKALKTSDPAQLTPWLMYWVVLSCVVLIESWTEWILVWVPFYAWIRFFFLLYLVLPQTQGARLIYEEYIFPKLEENETVIEEFIASSHQRLKTAGVAYLKQAIEYVKTQILGLPPTAQAAPPPPPARQTPQSYTQSLLARFTYPSTGKSPSTGGHLSSDFYSFLASAVSAATTAPAANPPTPTSPSALPTTAWNSLIPDAIRTAGAAARMSFIQTQRERLNVALSALDREEEAAKQDTGPHSMSLDGETSSRGNYSPARSVSGQSGASGLSKSRSEQDFEKLEAESGDEDRTGLHRRRPGVAPSQSSGWIPWGWGSGGSGDGAAGKSPGVENQ